MESKEQVREQKRMGATMLALAWIVLLALGIIFFTDFLGTQHNPNQSVHSRYGEDGVREIVLQRNRSGHYVTSGKINGQPVIFMLDTGATGVAVPEAMAKRLGLSRGRAFPTQTANGVSRAYAVTLGQRQRGCHRVARCFCRYHAGTADRRGVTGNVVSQAYRVYPERRHLDSAPIKAGGQNDPAIRLPTSGPGFVLTDHRRAGPKEIQC